MKPFECQYCGKCCGPIPVTIKELAKIKRATKQMDESEVERLRNQKRGSLTCPLRDVENKRCSIWEHRPEICRMQGFYVGLVCPNNREYATGSREDGRKRLEEAHRGLQPVGTLAIDITWGDRL